MTFIEGMEMTAGIFSGIQLHVSEYAHTILFSHHNDSCQTGISSNIK